MQIILNMLNEKLFFYFLCFCCFVCCLLIFLSHFSLAPARTLASRLQLDLAESSARSEQSDYGESTFSLLSR